MPFFPRCALVIVAYLLLTLIVTNPLCFRMTDHIYGGLADPLAFVWNFSWAHHALSTDPINLYHANRLYPLAYSFATTYQPVPLLFLFSPFYMLTGNQVWATNATLLATFVLCGFTMFLLMFHWTRNMPVSFITGCLFAFSPIRLPSEQLSLLGHFWTPLAILCVDKYYARQKLFYMAAAVLFTILQILTALETGFFLLFGIMLYVIFVNRWELWKEKRFLVHLGISVVLLVTCLFPFMRPYRALQAKFGFERSLGETIQFSADPISSYLRTKPENKLYGRLKLAGEYNPLPGEERLFGFMLAFAGKVLGEELVSAKLGIDIQPGERLGEKIGYRDFFEKRNRDDLATPLFQGFLTMILALAGYRLLRRSQEEHKRRIALIFGAITAFGFVMSLGPVLILYGHLTYIPMPYLLFYYVFPGFSILRGVYRFMFMVSFGLSVLGGFGFYYMLKKVENVNFIRVLKVWGTIGLTGIVTLIIVAESWSVPVPAARIEVNSEIPEVYRWLGRNKIEGAIIEIPTLKLNEVSYESDSPQRERQKQYNDREIKYLYYSTYHFKKLVNGVGSFLPPDRRTIFENLYRMPDSSALSFFRGLDIRTFVIHSGQLEPEDQAIWTPENIENMQMKEIFRDSTDMVLELGHGD